MKIAIDGPMRMTDGYSTAARGVIVGLCRLGIEAVAKSWPGSAPVECLEPEVRYALSQPVDGADVGIRFSQPDSAELAPGRFKVCFSMWEFDEVPRGTMRGSRENRRPVQSWPQGMERADAHFVPCEHSRRLWLAAGCSKPVRVVPLGFDPALYYWVERDYTGRPFTFVEAGTLSGRKNPELLITAFRRVFGDSPEARLVVKSCASLPVRCDPAPNLVVINQDWAHGHIRELYRQADVFVAPTQGEGFGLPLMEAMATGLPAIVTGWSAPLDFVTPEVGWLLDYEMRTMSSDWWLDEDTYQKFRYAQPRQEHLEELLLYCFEHRDEVREKGREACLRAFGGYTWCHVGRRILEVLRELEVEG